MQKSRLFEGLIIGIHLIPFGIVYDSTLLNTYDWYLYIPLVIGGILNYTLNFRKYSIEEVPERNFQIIRFIRSINFLIVMSAWIYMLKKDIDLLQIVGLIACTNLILYGNFKSLYHFDANSFDFWMQPYGEENSKISPLRRQNASWLRFLGTYSFIFFTPLQALIIFGITYYISAFFLLYAFTQLMDE
jgi:hypothetical protein